MTHTGKDIGHADTAAPQRAPNNGTYTTPIEYESSPEKEDSDSEGREYGHIERRGIEINLSSPVDDVERLRHRKHLAAQFHAENRDSWTEELHHKNDGGLLFDEVVLDLYEETLRRENIDPATCDISEPRLKALFLRVAREQNGAELHAYLAGTDPVDSTVHSLLGYQGPDAVPSYEVLQREFRDLDDNDEIPRDSFEAAVTRAVHAVYRAGVVLPDATRDEYNFDAVEPPLSESSVSSQTKQEELRNWVRLLTDKTTEPLTFGRDPQQTEHDMPAFIAALASSALFDCGLEQMKAISGWDYSPEHIPSGSWTHNYIPERTTAEYDLSTVPSESDSSSVPTVDEQFTQVHEKTMTLAQQFGCWSRSDSFNTGADMFRIDWAGDSLDSTIGRPAKPSDDKITQQWTFLVASALETERRFIFGGCLVPSKDSYPAALRKLISNTSESVDVGAIFLDAENVSGELINSVRQFVGDDWVISAPDQSIIKGLRRVTPRNVIGFAQNVSWNVANKPNVVTYPYNGSDPDLVEIDPDKISHKQIQKESKHNRVSVPYTSVRETETTTQHLAQSDSAIPALTDEFPDLAAQDGVGINQHQTHATYLTGRSLRTRSGTGVRHEYVQRWAIESSIGQLVNDFMPHITGAKPNLRVYAMHIGILFYNWHTMINRCASPGGLRLDITHTELLQAIRNVGFGPEEYDAFWLQ